MGSVDELVNDAYNAITESIGKPFLYMGYNCLIKQYTNEIGESHFCAYVELSWPMMNYFQGFNKAFTARKMNEKLDVHGGVTYIPNINHPHDKHLDLDGYWMGWDYIHLGDEETTIFDVIEDIQSVVQKLKRLEVEVMYG